MRSVEAAANPTRSIQGIVVGDFLQLETTVRTPNILTHRRFGFVVWEIR